MPHDLLWRKDHVADRIVLLDLAIEDAAHPQRGGVDASGDHRTDRAKTGKALGATPLVELAICEQRFGGCDVVDAGVTKDDVVDTLAWRLIARLADHDAEFSLEFDPAFEPVRTADRSQMGRQRLSQLDEKQWEIRDPGLLQLLTLMKVVPQAKELARLHRRQPSGICGVDDGAVGYRISKQLAFVQRNLVTLEAAESGFPVDVDAAPVCSRHGLLLFR